MDDEIEYWKLFGSLPVRTIENEGTMPDTKQEAQTTGYNFAKALGDVFVVHPEVQASQIIRLASKFALWEGYRGDFELGNEYVSGFLSGFWDQRHKAIESRKDE